MLSIKTKTLYAAPSVTCHVSRVTRQCLTLHRLLPRIPCACASRGMCARYFSLIRTPSVQYAIFAMNNLNTIHYGNIQQ